MPIISAITQRQSIRAYQDKPIAEEILERILEAGRLAPSARNLHNHKFIVIRDLSLRQAIATSADQAWIVQAPVIIVAVASNLDYVMRCGVPAHIADTYIALDHITLQAAEEGLGTCWIGSFDHNAIKEALRIPDNCKITALMPMGYPKENPPKKEHKPLNQLVCWDLFC